MSETHPAPITREYLNGLMAESAKQIAELTRRQAELAEQQAEFIAADEKRRVAEKEQWAAERAVEAAEEKRAMKNLRKELAGIGFGNGKNAEYHFITSLKRTMRLGGIQYDSITPNLRKKLKDEQKEAEFDVVMYNGTSIAIVEVKYCFRLDHVDSLIAKVADFRRLFPMYAGLKIYLAGAGLSFEDGAIDKAKKNGIGILTQEGRHIEHDTEGLREY